MLSSQMQIGNEAMLSVLIALVSISPSVVYAQLSSCFEGYRFCCKPRDLEAKSYTTEDMIGCMPDRFEECAGWPVVSQVSDHMVESGKCSCGPLESFVFVVYEWSGCLHNELAVCTKRVSTSPPQSISYVTAEYYVADYCPEYGPISLNMIVILAVVASACCCSLAGWSYFLCRAKQRKARAEAIATPTAVLVPEEQQNQLQPWQFEEDEYPIALPIDEGAL